MTVALPFFSSVGDSLSKTTKRSRGITLCSFPSKDRIHHDAFPV